MPNDTLPDLPIRRVYLNGAFLAPHEARVSAFDRGFVFGDGVYEVIPVYGRRPFRLRPHLDRLEASLRAIDLANPLSRDQWGELLASLLEGEEGDDHSVYLQVTRGPAARDHAFPKTVHPTVFAFSQPLKYPDEATRRAGVRAITVEDIRWLRCDIKAIALLANVLLREEAARAGAYEAVLLRDGWLTEGAASNIFVVTQGVLVTPPRGPLILPGVTRDLILELARAHGLTCAERPVARAELFAAEELWMTSSTKEILSITRLDDRPIGGGRPGPLSTRLQVLYAAYKEDFRDGKVE